RRIRAPQLRHAEQDRVERRALDPRPHPWQGLLEPGRRVASEYPGIPAGRGRQPEQHADRGRLAGAVGPEEAVHTAGGYAQVEFVDGELVAEAFGQAMGLDGRFAHATACSRSTGTAPRKTCPCGVIRTLSKSVLRAAP